MNTFLTDWLLGLDFDWPNSYFELYYSEYLRTQSESLFSEFIEQKIRLVEMNANRPENVRRREGITIVQNGVATDAFGNPKSLREKPIEQE